ncbi:MAG: phosphoribosylaminoimidazolesuccinocarboxamide synthase, partial [Alphaproteobacteria bacterium]|nr:phosphoribosylaminoimidazolesuccinocarboxamide synthase [Alphaproteobacteria bacterium]
MDTSSLAPFLPYVLRDATIAALPNHYRGKVRDNYDLPDGRRIVIASDRLSAFDIILTALPFKGEVLTQTARFWFDATRDICPNHVIEYPDPNVLVCRRLKIMPVEVVVRDYLAGTTSTSIWSMYKAGQRTMYGVTLPDGMRENQKLDASIITPTTKAMDGAHDAPLTPDEIVS